MDGAHGKPRRSGKALDHDGKGVAAQLREKEQRYAQVGDGQACQQRRQSLGPLCRRAPGGIRGELRGAAFRGCFLCHGVSLPAGGMSRHAMFPPDAGDWCIRSYHIGKEKAIAFGAGCEVFVVRRSPLC